MNGTTRCRMLIAIAIVAGGFLGCDKSDDAKTSASGAGGAVTPKAAPGDPGLVPQPANPATPATGPGDVASVAETPAGPPSGDTSSNGGGKRESAGGASWEMPAGWSRGPDQQMRLATIGDGSAEVAISAFPGDVGGSMLNINRWRGQLGLPPVASDADAEKLMSTVDVGGRKIRVADMAGKRARMLVAIVPGDGRLFFFKMMGQPDVVEKHKAAFDGLVKSIRVE